MTIADSTKARPHKPYPEFSLFAHNNGQWCRKIRGKLYSFGKWDDPTAALKKHNAEYSYLKENEGTRTRQDGAGGQYEFSLVPFATDTSRARTR